MNCPLVNGINTAVPKVFNAKTHFILQGVWECNDAPCSTTMPYWKPQEAPGVTPGWQPIPVAYAGPRCHAESTGSHFGKLL